MGCKNKFIVALILMLALPMILYSQSKQDIMLLNKCQLNKDFYHQWKKMNFHQENLKLPGSATPFWKPQSDATATQWECLGPEGGNVSDMVFDPTNPAIIYVAPATGPCPIFKTTNGGENWTVVGVVEIAVLALAIDPNNPATLYAGGQDRKIYKSTDSGANWIGYEFSSSYDWIYSMATHPNHSNIIYAGADYWDGLNYKMAVMKSINGGLNWRVTAFGTDYGAGYAIAIDPQHPDTVYVGGYSGSSAKIFKTVNGATSWSEITTGLIGSSVNCLTVHPTMSNIVFAGTALRLHKSIDGGGLWSLCGSFQTNDLAINPNTPAIMFAGSSGAVYKSIDGGSIWTVTGGGTPMADINAMLIDPTDGNVVYAGGQLGILKTVNGGTAWALANSGFIAAEVTELQVPQTSPNILYIAIANDALYKSSDYGQSWQRLQEFEGCTGIMDLAVSSINPDIVYVLSGG